MLCDPTLSLFALLIGQGGIADDGGDEAHWMRR